MCFINGVRSSFSSKKENNCLNTKDEANNPNKTIIKINMAKEINVFKKGIPVKPTKENKFSKNLNILRNNNTVIPIGIKTSKP